MKKMIATAATALMMSSPLFAAEANIHDLNAAEGTALVVVKQVIANDAAGEPRILFNDASGAVMQVGELSQIDEVLSARLIGEEGEYRNLHVVLDGDAFVVGRDHVQSVALEQGLGGTVLRLDGRLQVSRNFVGTNTDFAVIDTPTRFAARQRDEVKG